MGGERCPRARGSPTIVGQLRALGAFPQPALLAGLDSTPTLSPLTYPAADAELRKERLAAFNLTWKELEDVEEKEFREAQSAKLR